MEREGEEYSSPTPWWVGGENEKPDSFCRTTKDWAELNPDLAERRITPGCLGDFFLRGGTGYNKTLPLIIASHRILVELKICDLNFMKDHESRSG